MISEKQKIKISSTVHKLKRINMMLNETDCKEALRLVKTSAGKKYGYPSLSALVRILICEFILKVRKENK